MRLGNSKYEIVTTRMGAISIRDNVTQEIMHNPVGPWLEANSLYIEQSQLAERLVRGNSSGFTVFDVGLGAAANALAVLHCARTLEKRVPLTLISYECDLSLLHFALENAHRFSHFSGYESAVRAILDHGSWHLPVGAGESGIRWELRAGDFAQTIAIEKEKCNLILYDPYSPGKNPDMWNLDIFSRVFATCVKSELGGALLLTYSRATAVRVALLLSGFFVGVGAATGSKDETTQASTRVEELSSPLPKAWLQRWLRSSKPYFDGTSKDRLVEIHEALNSHPQFKV